MSKVKKGKWIDTRKKERAPRKDFSQRFAEKLRDSGLGEVTEGDLDQQLDDRWVELKKGNIKLSIEFDAKGEKIERVGLFKEVWEVVSEEQIFAFNEIKASGTKYQKP